MGPEPTSPDYEGAYQFLQACDYTAASRTGADINYVVIHTVQGSYSGCISWFQNCSSEVSAHYVVRSSDGQITQMLHEQDIGWHAGNWTYNSESIGIEHEGYISEPDTWYTDEMYGASAALVADIVSRTAVSADRSHIIGHVEVPGATHTDPGTGWDWDYYMSLVTGSTTISGSVVGVVAVDDIYNGERLAGVDVWLDETSEHVLTDDLGAFGFDGLPAGSYTVRAALDGYTEGMCTTSVDASDTFWCSMAVLEDDGSDSGDTDTDTAPEAPGDGVVPGVRVRQDVAHSGCGCNAGSSAGWLFAVLVPLLRRRR
jgi:Synergist-CTERM protein sorting domain-containing protein